MDSITQKPLRGRFQEIKHKKVEVFRSGLYYPKQGKAFVPSCLTAPDRKQRGRISGFSAHARQRLRRTLLESTLPNSQRLGFTLTLPWRDVDFESEQTLDAFRDCFHRFGVKFRRAFPNSAAIFRVELQQRKAPHIHAIWYLAQSDIERHGLAAAIPADAGVTVGQARALLLLSANFQIGRLWSTSVPLGPTDNIEAFLDHGTRVDDIASDGAMFRYLADHTSKQKQAQLGYKGKQWGVLGKSNLVAVDPDEYDFKRSPVGAKSRAVLLRALQKVTRYRLSDRRAPFGFKYVRSRRLGGVFYVANTTISRLLSSPRVSVGLRRSQVVQILFHVEQNVKHPV